MYRIAVFILATAFAAFGQVSSGTLSGEVRDESGGLVPGARVGAHRLASGFTRTSVSDALGRYQIPDLPPGTYTLSAEKSGFRAMAVSGVVIEVNQRARLDFNLKIGTERDAITVSATVSPLRTDDASAGYHLGNTIITELPLNGRDVISLVTLGPGAIPRHLSGFTHDIVNDVQPARGATALNPPVNGARSTMNTYVLDGAYNTDRNAFAIAVAPPMESVQEFRTESSVGPAEFAQSGGGVVDIATKSGSRSFHGNLFEFFRNEATDARNYFDDPALPRPIFRQNQFGASLGGPIRKSSTFFYAAYEGLKGESARSTLHLVPGAAVRAGDFSGRAPIFDPLSFDAAAGTRQPFPNGMIPASRIDPIAQRYLQLYEPLPNLAPGGQSNYLDATPNQNDNASGSFRIDHQFRENNALFARYTINDDRARLAGNFPERATTEDLRAQQFAIGHTLAGGNWVNEVRASFTRLRVFDLAASAFATDVIRDLGIDSPASDPATFGLPFFVVNDFDTVTDSTRTPQTQRDNTRTLADGVTISRGRHTWKAGFQWINFQLNYLQSDFLRGRYIFNGAFTSDPANPAATGDAFADFLLGFAQSTRRTAGSAQAYLRQNSSGAYVQDDWRIASNLTLNIGLRYEYTAPFSELRNNLVNLDYSNLPSAPRLVRVNQANQPDRNNFAPRAGLAWKLPHLFGSRASTVFRAGYGIYYTSEIAVEAYDLVRNNIRNEINETTGPVPLLTLRDGFPVNSSAGFPSYFGLDPRARTPYLQQWNAGFQREIGAGIVLDVSYIGSKGTKLGRFRTFNTPLHVETGENLAPRPGDLQSLRTFPELGPLFQRQHIANSSYNSLQIKADKRFSGRLSFLTSFVWSKSIDDADTVIPGLSDSFGAQDERNLRLERGLSSFNVGRRLSAGFVYNIPRGRMLKPLFANWSTSGIVTLQDGSPWNPVYFGADIANSGTPNRPNVVPGQSVNLPDNRRSAEEWFNRDAFSDPQPFTFGNAGRNTLPSPGNAVVDLSLHRRFAVTERAAIQFRAEGFNVFNHPNWGIPGQYPDFGPFFGKIFTTGEPRRFQFALRLDF
jgi:hypothetical protein